jgi:hypothetical protein
MYIYYLLFLSSFKYTNIVEKTIEAASPRTRVDESIDAAILQTLPKLLYIYINEAAYYANE